MTTKEAAALIDRTGSVRIGTGEQSLLVRVTIVNHRVVFGQDQVRLTPIAGAGSIWVSVERVVLDDPADVPYGRADVRRHFDKEGE